MYDRQTYILYTNYYAALHLMHSALFWLGLVIALLMVFLKNALMCILKSLIN